MTPGDSQINSNMVIQSRIGIIAQGLLQVCMPALLFPSIIYRYINYIYIHIIRILWWCLKVLSRHLDSLNGPVRDYKMNYLIYVNSWQQHCCYSPVSLEAAGKRMSPLETEISLKLSSESWSLVSLSGFPVFYGTLISEYWYYFFRFPYVSIAFLRAKACNGVILSIYMYLCGEKPMSGIWIRILSSCCPYEKIFCLFF